MIADTVSPNTEGKPLLSAKMLAKPVTIVALAAFADWLFYGRVVGISLLVFLFALNAGVFLNNPVRAARRTALIAVGVYGLAIAPLVVEVSFLSVMFAVLGTACLVVTMIAPGLNWREVAMQAVGVLFSSVWRAPSDIVDAKGEMPEFRGVIAWRRVWVSWAVPLGLGLVFLWLFAIANPLLDLWLSAFDPAWAFEQISLLRIAFWLTMILLVWPFVFLRLQDRWNAWLRNDADAEPVAPRSGALSQGLLGPGAIMRSLILFNVLFATQTVLDAMYLWGGVALPNGMTYAAYAHRGAYPLMVTALLAALFVLVAMRPGSEAGQSRLIRGLVFAWAAQNILLVISAILRLDLYVEVYSLTYWRVAAFVWMALVAIGLALIVARILFQRSNAWLLSMNVGALTLALYASCFVNLPNFIATYNVSQSPEMNGKGVHLDIQYLRCLGVHAIPAFDAYIDNHLLQNGRVVLGGNAGLAVEYRNKLAAQHRAQEGDWRGWNYRDWQLSQYLKERAANPAVAGPAGTRL